MPIPIASPASAFHRHFRSSSRCSPKVIFVPSKRSSLYWYFLIIAARFYKRKWPFEQRPGAGKSDHNRDPARSQRGSYTQAPRPSGMYPLRFKPILKSYVWGGRRLATVLGKELPRGGVVAESWEISDRDNDQSVVANGPLSGKTLRE